jgi:hypothetical protein
MPKSPLTNGDLHLSYLEALDAEYWALLGQPAPSAAPLRDEYLAARRTVIAAASRDREAQAKAQTALHEAEDAFRHALLARLHKARRSALCFSGGGIRSATFGLGILQGLAAQLRTIHRALPGAPGHFSRLGQHILGVAFARYSRVRHGGTLSLSAEVISPGGTWPYLARSCTQAGC